MSVNQLPDGADEADATAEAGVSDAPASEGLTMGCGKSAESRAIRALASFLLAIISASCFSMTLGSVMPPNIAIFSANNAKNNHFILVPPSLTGHK
ncbi:hypothetical protein [Neisseria elongata]|uniref:hypothetical protein n=1 Tax=Neisseria elongata TaxID=495 RepID=UPI001D12FDE9|nr:hypothetical protein [Neisseria elongata]